jgi:hypothetical protein
LIGDYRFDSAIDLGFELGSLRLTALFRQQQGE